MSTYEELEFAVQQGRLARAARLQFLARAKELGLDPETALPEDVELLDGEDGKLIVQAAFMMAKQRLEESDTVLGRQMTQVLCGRQGSSHSETPPRRDAGGGSA